MPLSNSTLVTLQSGPYWDDFNDTKNFHRVLIKPKFPVQARELNQIQSIAQHQVDQLTSGVFKEGRPSVGGESTFSNTVIALQLIRNENVDIAAFYDTTTNIGWTARGLTSQATGKVLQYDRQQNQTYTGVVIAPITSEQFVAGETVQFTSPTGTTQSLTVASPIPSNPAAIYAIQAGTFYLRGHLVNVPQQTVVLSTNTSAVTCRVGFRVNEEIVTAQSDSSLLDPAFGTTNYAAPGADRLKITGTLTSKNSIDPDGDANFIEIARIVGGVPVTPVDRLVPEFIEETLARRTYDESGDYVVRPFRLIVKDHNPSPGVPNVAGRITGNTTSNIITGVDTMFDTEIKVGDVLIVNGDRRAVTVITSNAELQIASSFSVPFTNTTFTAASSSKVNFELEAGKAYIRGVEFETSGTTILEAARPRTSVSRTADSISAFYGPYTFVKRPAANAQLLNISTVQKVALHCVHFDDILKTHGAHGAVPFDVTKIGTAYIRAFQYHSGIGDANTVYKAYLVGADLESSTLIVNTAVGASTTQFNSISISPSTNAVTLVQNSSSTVVLAVTNNAYVGATLILEKYDGGFQPYRVVLSNTVDSVDNHTTTFYVHDAAYLETCKTGVNTSITLSFSDRCIRSISHQNDKTHGLNVDVSAKVGGAATGETIFYGTDSTSAIFQYPTSWIVATTANNHILSGTRYLGGVAPTTGGGNATHDYYSIDVGTTYFEEVYNTPDAVLFRDIVVSNSSNQIVPLIGTSTLSEISGGTASLRIPKTYVGNTNINVYLRVDLNGTPIAKSLVSGNTSPASVAQTAGVLQSELSRGHVAINTLNVASPTVVSLGVPDVYSLKSVYAYPDPSNTAGYVDVTSRYRLDTGQRDWCYDYASLVLRPGQQHYSDANNVVAVVDYFSHGTTNNHGYFTALSYTAGGFPYENIPEFTDPVNGTTLSLRDRVDFRAVRTANVASANVAVNPYTGTGANAVFTTQLLPLADSTIISSYEFYLPRVDKVVVTRNRRMSVIAGIPDIDPIPPADVDDGITLYTVTYPPYLANTSLVQIRPVDHRRYTMRDIGKLEKRIENLEYYVQLSLLEERTLNEPEFDGTDIERFKNGILIDPFSSSAVANPSDIDYRASIDEQNRQLRPSFVSYGYNLGNFVPAGSGGSEGTVNANGAVLLQYADYVAPTTAVEQDLSAPKQPLASKLVNINPFNVSAWVGSVTLRPDRDIWFDSITREPSVTVNLYGENDSFENQPLGTIWGDWQTTWTGVSSSATVASTMTVGMHRPGDPDTRMQWTNIALQQERVATTLDQRREGSQLTAKFSRTESIVGNKLVDLSVVPHMRQRDVYVSATGMRPGSTVRAFFDEQDVTNFVERCNEIELTVNAVSAGFKVGEPVYGILNSPDQISAMVVGIVGNRLYVANHEIAASGQFTPGIGVEQRYPNGSPRIDAGITEFYQWSSVLSSVASASSMTLALGSTGTTGAYVGQTLSITRSSVPGLAGQSRVITSYTAGTGEVTVSPAFTSTPKLGDTYTIGALSTHPLPINIPTTTIDGYVPPDSYAVSPGSFFGMFRLPGGRFSTGRRVFRLADTVTINDSATKAEGFYESSGTLATQEAIRVASRNVNLQSTKVTSAQTLENVTTNMSLTSTFTGVYIDPLAQTFMVDAEKFPKGMFITSVDLFFGRIDPNRSAPVRVQIRPTVNGYPSSDNMLPHAESVLYPTNVVPPNTRPDITNASHRTRFDFPRPVYVQPAVEYAIVILSDSFEYEVFVGEIGQPIIGSVDKSLISEQPYGGSLFKSQNARTWTPVQEEDLMFVLNRAVFATSGIARFDLSSDSRGIVQQSLQAATSRFLSQASLDAINYTASPSLVLANVTSKVVSEPPPTLQTRRALETAMRLYGDFDYDVFQLNTDYFGWDPVEYDIRPTLTSGVADSTSSIPVVRPGQNIFLPSRRRIVASNTSGSVRVSANIRTDDPAVSPMFDLDNLSFIAVRNVIDNGGLYANGFYVETQASNNAAIPGNVISLTIAGGSGSGAIATATVNSLGHITGFTVTDAGSGYVTTPTVTLETTSSTYYTTDPVIKYRGETDDVSDIIGEEKARYISRRVSLADGFDARDLKVYISAQRPTGSNIDIYYKVLGTGDRDTFNNRPWTLLPIDSDVSNVYTTNEGQYREFSYTTAPNYTVEYTSNGTEYPTFHTFAIKVVLRTSNPSQPPVLRNLRVIALDS